MRNPNREWSADFYRRATALAAALTAAFGVIGVAVLPALGSSPGRTWDTLGGALMWFALMLGAAVVAALLARNQPTNPLGWWLSGGAALGGLMVVADEYAALTLEARPGIAPGGTVALLLSSVALHASWALLGAHVPLRFPTGQLLSQRWRWVAHLATLSAFLIALEIFHPRAFDDSEVFLDLPGVTNPIGIRGFGAVAETAFGIGILTLFAATFAAIASLVVRYRRAGAVERQQLRWITFGTVVMTVVMLVCANLANAVEGSARGFFLGISGVMPLLLIASLGIAVLRHGLFDINVIIRRTVLYALLASFIALTYIAVAVGIGGLLGRDGSSDVPVSIIATALVAVAFQPVRRRFELMANRLVYGEVVPPYELMSGLSRRMGGTLSPDAALHEIASAVGRGLRARGARVRLELPTGSTEAVWRAEDSRPAERFDIVRSVSHREQTVGEIAVATRAEDPPGAGELRVLDDLVSHAGVALDNLRLTAELQRRLDDLRASRQRLVEAQNDERRRMERDIHDGAQQHLVALQIKLGVARSTIEESPEEADALFTDLQAGAREALETVRALGRGLFPPTLAERGLARALEADVEKANLPAVIDWEDLGDARFETSTEAAVYFCIREALQNASKHAPGSPLHARLAYDGAELAFDVRDEGPGFDPAAITRGSGLQNMVDRVEALDGTLTFSSEGGQGTTVSGRVPIERLP